MTIRLLKPLTVASLAAGISAIVALHAAAESSLAETYDNTHLTAEPNRPYVVNPPLSEATIEKRKKGYWSGPYGNVWVQPSLQEIDSLERRQTGRSAQQWSNQ